MVKKILHLEGLVLFLTALLFYYLFHGNWIIFILLLFTPDISMLGYLKSKKWGAILYNIVHNYALAIICCVFGALLYNDILLFTGLILLAHVGLDRLLGFGLKYPMNFKETHLQKV